MVDNSYGNGTIIFIGSPWRVSGTSSPVACGAGDAAGDLLAPKVLNRHGVHAPVC